MENAQDMAVKINRRTFNIQSVPSVLKGAIMSKVKSSVSPKNAPFAGLSQKKILQRRHFMFFSVF